MKENILDRLMSKKGLYVGFWSIAIIMAVTLIGLSAYMVKEVPPIPQTVRTEDGRTLYSGEDVVNGKALFQQFDLMDYGTMLGMGAYLGPEFAGEFMHRRAVFLNEAYAQKLHGKRMSELDPIEIAQVKASTIQDVRNTSLKETEVVYSKESADAYLSNRDYLIDFLVNGNKENAWRGGIITRQEASTIAAFVDWGQLSATTLRPGKNRTWTNNWPSEPMLDQNIGWSSIIWSLAQTLILWTFTILIIYLVYEFLIGKEETRETPLKITSLFPSQEKLLKYLPIVALFFLLQTVLGGYLAHIYTEPSENFLISQEIMPFNITRALHINLAILWVAIGWLVGGLFIAPLVGGKDLRFPWLVNLLYVALLVVGGGGLIGIYLGAQGQMRDLWFWFGNEGREYLNLGRVWDTGLVIGLVLWFLMVYSTIRKAKENTILVGTILWSAFGVATLYMAGMAPFHKIMPNYTMDDYYRWWVVHLWVELTFELFSAGVLAFLAVALGLVGRKTAERVLLFELFLVALSGMLGVGHHYWWQGLDEYWIAVGSVFSALEPIPLVILMIEAWKQYKHIKSEGNAFEFTLPFMWLTGSAFLNWFGAGFLGMIANLPVVNYYSHGTYLIMPHGHVALLGAFGYISIAFLYIVARTRAQAKGLPWSDTTGKWAFVLVTVGIVLFAIPTLYIGLHQTATAFESGYYVARSRETIEEVLPWLWARIIPDGVIILGALLLFIDILKKSLPARSQN